MALAQKKYYTAEDYYNMPENIRAELINGEIVYMAAPSRIHQEILMELSTLINNYIKSKEGNCKVYPAPFSVQLRKSEDTVIEPDISVICDKNKLNRRGCLGAPDWIIEIVSPSNPEHDYIDKLSLYTKASVREYWIVDPQTRNIYVYSLEPEHFSVKVYTFHDTVKAGIYEDLFIDFAAFDLDELF
ncbi:MAG: Uma2 family endonuclease [Lachnospiraceae bacterium]|nr:Uma2 family endonuclease [Lachnospiraceae bacterium]